MSRDKATSAVTTAVLIGLVMCTITGAQHLEEGDSGSRVHIGIFDSRAVAMAYYRSEAFNLQMKERRAEYEAAKSAGNDKRIQEMEVEGTALQEQMHKQGFSAWPVNNILDTIKEELPMIAEQANVEVIVSKWNIAYQRSGVEFRDITALVVRAFKPDKKTLKMIEEIQKQDPVSPEAPKNKGPRGEG